MTSARRLGVAAIVLGLCLAAVGWAEASGNGGACFGTWEAWYDVEHDTWVYEWSTFTCEGDCAGDDVCRKMVIEQRADGSKSKICACDTGKDWQYDQVYANGTPSVQCSATGEYPPGSGYACDVTCQYDACPEGQVCERYIFWTGWSEERETWTRKFRCQCE